MIGVFLLADLDGFCYTELSNFLLCLYSYITVGGSWRYTWVCKAIHASFVDDNFSFSAELNSVTSI